jgi:hypothetical protein
MTQEPTLMIAANLDVAGAVLRHEQLVADSEAGDFWIEFDGERPTALALQLAVSTRKTLGISDRFLGFGPHAAQAFNHISF